MHTKEDEGTPLSYRSKKYLGEQKGKDKGFFIPITLYNVFFR